MLVLCRVHCLLLLELELLTKSWPATQRLLLLLLLLRDVLAGLPSSNLHCLLASA
jgi:hypothetical protein